MVLHRHAGAPEDAAGELRLQSVGRVAESSVMNSRFTARPCYGPKITTNRVTRQSPRPWQVRECELNRYINQDTRHCQTAAHNCAPFPYTANAEGRE